MDTLPKLTMSDLDAAEARRARAFEQREGGARIDTRDDAANVIYLHALRLSHCRAPSLCDHGERCTPDCEEAAVAMAETPAPPYPIHRAIFGPYRRSWWRKFLDSLQRRF